MRYKTSVRSSCCSNSSSPKRGPTGRKRSPGDPGNMPRRRATTTPPRGVEVSRVVDRSVGPMPTPHIVYRAAGPWLRCFYVPVRQQEPYRRDRRSTRERVAVAACPADLTVSFIATGRPVGSTRPGERTLRHPEAGREGALRSPRTRRWALALLPVRASAPGAGATARGARPSAPRDPPRRPGS